MSLALNRRNNRDEAPAIAVFRSPALPSIDGGRGADDAVDHDAVDSDGAERSLSALDGDADPAADRWRLKIAIALQKSLDPMILLEEFSNRLSERIPHGGLRVQAISPKTRPVVDYAIGRSGRRFCGLPIDLHRSGKGYRSTAHATEMERDARRAILFFRDTPFCPQEKEDIARAVALLESPLRNALTHQAALRGIFEDPLTGAYNRAMMDEVLAHEIENAARQGTPLALMMIDIDDFKRINDRLGHLAGDRILVDFVKRIQGGIRKKDRLFRYGGDEFALLASHTDAAGIRRMQKRLRTAIEDSSFELSGFDGLAFDAPKDPISIPIRAAFGIAEYRSGDNPLELISRADKELYREKRKA
ncbi:MAG: GGDEF domain-containing protein [Ectothiorhodospiraceae bacterium AqS1]|nr:GGDEF domain-containing protein [Ectothiorhodospiraceae bacterium AqS1]